MAMDEESKDEVVVARNLASRKSDVTALQRDFLGLLASING